MGILNSFGCINTTTALKVPLPPPTPKLFHIDTPNKFLIEIVSSGLLHIILISFPTIVNSNTDYEKQYAFPNNIWYS